MQDRFTRQAKKALQLAKEYADALRHNYIGTEHILMGLLKEKEGTAGMVLSEFGVEEDKLETLIRQTVLRRRRLRLWQREQSIHQERRRSSAAVRMWRIR